MSETKEEIGADNVRRLNILAQRGQQVQGLREHYIIALLEHLVSHRAFGEEELEEVRLNHELWVREQLNALEPKIAGAVLLANARAAKPIHHGRTTDNGKGS